MSKFPEFRPGLGAENAHIALKKSIAIMNRAQHCAVLWFGEIMRHKLYRELGFSTMRAYALEELGFSPTRAGDFIRLAKRLEKLPLVKKEMARGKLGYTKAREIATVAVPANEKAWVQEAQKKSRRDLTATVKHAKAVARQARDVNPDQVELLPTPRPTSPTASVPVHVGFELTPLQSARYEALLAKVDHRGNKAELLLAMAEALVAAAENAPRGATLPAHQPNYQIHVHRCPECEQNSVPRPHGEVELGEKEAGIVACDARIHAPGKRNTTTIPPRIRREVLTRDRHRCRRKGCSHTRYLDLHHLVPRAQGGANEPENLVTLCTACHELWHSNGGDLRKLLRKVAAT